MTRLNRTGFTLAATDYREGRRVGFAATVVLVVSALTASGCVRHIYPYNHKVRDYTAPEFAPPDAQRTEGSLWSEGAHGLFEDPRARRVGDILTIKIDERSVATRDASTQTARSNKVDIGISAFLSAMTSLQKKYPGLDPAALVGAQSNSDFSGSGTTSRSGNFTATLPVHVMRQLPNGDLYVEGNKVVLLNDEESYLDLSGVVRPIDIQQDNSVASSLLADVELEYTGRGVLSEPQSPGWLSRALDYIWPF